MSDSLNYHPETDKHEHDRVSRTKKVLNYGWDTNSLQAVKLAVDVDGGLTITPKDQASIIDEASATTTYFGYAPIGTATSSASWKVKRVVESGTTITTTWADGNNNYDNTWDNRASLSYS